MGASNIGGDVLCRTFFRTYELPMVIGRPFCGYGPRGNPDLALVEVSRYLRWHLNGKPIQIDGDVDRKTRDFVHVSGVVQGLLLLAERGGLGEIYNVGSGEEVTMRQLAKVIGSVTGHPAAVEAISHITDDTYRLVGDIIKIKSLGYTPGTAPREGVRQLAQELGERPALPFGETIFKRGQRITSASHDDKRFVLECLDAQVSVGTSGVTLSLGVPAEASTFSDSVSTTPGRAGGKKSYVFF